MHACMYACMHACMYVCMYVLISIYIYTQIQFAANVMKEGSLRMCRVPEVSARVETFFQI